MVAQKIPLNDMQFGEKEAIYVAALERRVAYQELMIGKYNVLMEMMTGEQWDDLRLDSETNFEGIKAIAHSATQRRMAVSFEQASRIIDERIAAANSGTMPNPKGKVEYVT